MPWELQVLLLQGAEQVNTNPYSHHTQISEVSDNTKILPMEQNPSLEVTSVMNGIFLLLCWTRLKQLSKHSGRNAGLDETQAGLKIARRNVNNLSYAGDTILMAESEEELKSLLMKVKEESKNVGLKLNIEKTKIMASGLITSWQIDGETMETVADFILGGSKITANGDCSYEIKRCLLLEKKKLCSTQTAY